MTDTPAVHGTSPKEAETPPRVPVRVPGGPVGGPSRPAWREGTLTRAKELEALCSWAWHDGPRPRSETLFEAIDLHLTAAREAAVARRRGRDQALLERAISNLDAAEALLLDVAPAEYVLSRLPGVLNDVTRHLSPTDIRRQELERVARQVGLGQTGPRTRAGVVVRTSSNGSDPDPVTRLEVVDQERLGIAAAARAASSGALREQLRVRSFRNVLVVTTTLLTALAVSLVLTGLLSPAAIPLCFQPEKSGQTVVVCPTAQSSVFPTGQQTGPASEAVDAAVHRTVRPLDILVVELAGLAAAAVAAAAAIRGMRGSSEPHSLPVVLAVLKLPTGAITAVLGLLLMRGQFVPGLSALDTSAQILAWALVFGYAQQVFTRLVDQQAHTVLDAVRGGGDRARARPPAPS